MRGRQSPGDDLERLLLVSTGMALAAAWVVFRIDLNGPAADYKVFEIAAQHWRAPYDRAVYLAPGMFAGQTAAGGQVLFAYPPTFLLLAKPFSLLPFAWGMTAWTAISYGLFLLAASFLHLRAAWLLILAPVAMVFFVGFGGPPLHHPILEGVGAGQTSHWTGAGLIAAGLLLDRRPALAGALLAFVACIKPTAVLVAPFVLWGRWRAMAAAVLTGVGLVAATLPLAGAGLWLEWLDAGRAFAGGTYQLQPAALVDHPAFAILLFVAGAWFALRDRQLPGLLVGGILCTPYMMPYDLAALTALGAAWMAGGRKNWQLALVGMVLLLGLVGDAAALLAVCVVVVLVHTARAWPSSRAATADRETPEGRAGVDASATGGLTGPSDDATGGLR